METESINPFIESTVATFEGMCDTTVERDGTLTMRKGIFATYDLIGLIGLSGDVRGAVMLTMDVDTGVQLVSAFVGEPVKDNSDELMDGFGELVNIIAGSAGNKFNGFRVEIALPTVFSGRRIQTGANQRTPWIVIPMKFAEWGKFCIEVTMERV